jgi:hypothetical protein
MGLMLNEPEGVMRKVYVAAIARWFAHADTSDSAEKSEVLHADNMICQCRFGVSYW